MRDCHREAVLCATARIGECKIICTSDWRSDEHAAINRGLKQFATNECGEVIAPLRIILSAVELRVFLDLPSNGLSVESWIELQCSSAHDKHIIGVAAVMVFPFLIEQTRALMRA